MKRTGRENKRRLGSVGTEAPSQLDWANVNRGRLLLDTAVFGRPRVGVVVIRRGGIFRPLPSFSSLPLFLLRLSRRDRYLIGRRKEPSGVIHPIRRSPERRGLANQSKFPNTSRVG